MKPANQARPDGRETPAARPEPDVQPGKTPAADMQAEDVGTPESGVDSGTAAGRAMKQTSKTSAESGNQR